MMGSDRSITRRGFIKRSVGTGVVGLALGASLSLAGEGEKTGNAWQIGCYTRPWDKYEYLVALDAIAEAGFKYAGLMTAKAPGGLVVNVDTPVEEAQKVGAECKKRGLKIPSLYGGDIPVGKSLEEGIAGLKRLIDNCSVIGVSNLMMGGVGDEKLYDAYFKAIAECCDYAAQKGIGISMKPHGGLNATGPQCRKAVEKVGNKNFRIWYDAGNIFYYSDGKLNPIDDAATVDGLVVGMSIKDFKMPKDVMLTPGTGMVDFPKVMARLKKGGFTGGPLLVECLSQGDLPFLLAEAKKARGFLESLVATLDAK